MIGAQLKPGLPLALAAAARALDAGEPALIYDAADREGETDLVILSHLATPELVRLSVGLEDLDDILWDLDQALSASQA